MSDLIRKLNLRLGSICLGIITLYLILFMFPISYYGFWTDSELWSSSTARGLFSNFVFSFAMKPLFSLVLWVLTLFPSHPNFLTIDAARMLFLVNSLFILFLIFYITKCLSNTFWGIFAVFICISTYYFTYRGIQVRSDFLATSFMLSAILVLMHLKNQRAFSRLWILGTLLLLALLSTPKAIYLVIGLFPFIKRYISNEDLRFARPDNKSLVGLLTGSFIVIPLLIKADFFQATLHSWNFFLNAFSEENRGFSYLSRDSFLYVFDFLKKDIVFASTLTICFFASLFSWKKNSDIKTWGIFSAFLIAILILHPDKLPYFISSYLPFFSIFVSLFLAHTSKQNSVKKNSYVFALAIALFIGSQIIPSLKNRLDVISKHHNKEQRTAINYLTEFFQPYENLRIFDSVGVLQSRVPDYLFVGPASVQETNRVLHVLRTSPPDVILMTNKVSLIYPHIANFLSENYIGTEHGVFVRATTIKVSKSDLKSGFRKANFYFDLNGIFGDKWKKPNVFWMQALDENGQEIQDLKMYSFTPKTKADFVQIPANSSSLKVTIYNIPEVPLNKRLDELFRFDIAW